MLQVGKKHHTTVVLESFVPNIPSSSLFLFLLPTAELGSIRAGGGAETEEQLVKDGNS